MTLYEMNQQAYKALSNMIDKDINKNTKDLADLINKSTNNFFMMVCNELHYYTLFTWRNRKNHKPYNLAKEIIDVSKTLGNLKAIEISDDHAEIWIENNDECNMYMFFQYDAGVIEV